MKELTDQEKETLKSLVNPDDPTEHKYHYDSRQQQAILAMLLLDKNFLVQSYSLIKPKYFVDRAHILICQILFDYFGKYKQLPNKSVIINEVRERMSDAPVSWYYVGELNHVMQSYLPGLETRDYLLDKITEFAKEQALRVAIAESLDIIVKRGEDRWTKIWDLMRNAILTDRNFDLGLDYFSEVETRYERMLNEKRKGEIFTSGFPTVDYWLGGGGLGRGEIGAFLGLPGVGKTGLLVRAATQNLNFGHKVLFISLEMSQDKLAQRFDVQLSRLSLLRNSQDYFLDPKNIPSVKEALKEQSGKHEDKRRLIIKQWPAGSADVNTIRAFLAQLSLYNWRPDLILVDYVGEMKDVEGLKTYESRQRLVRELRALAMEEEMCIMTALQPNKMARQQQEDSFIDDDALADAFGQARPLDALWSLNMNKREAACNLGRLFVVKHRDGVSRRSIWFKRNTDTLDIVEIEKKKYDEILSTYVEKSADTVDEKIRGFRKNGV